MNKERLAEAVREIAFEETSPSTTLAWDRLN
jgi:hypothetical protein